MAGLSTLDPQHTALLIMDYQNEILARYGEGSQATLDRAESLLMAARDAGVQVIYVTVAFRPGYPEVNPRSPGFSAIRETGRLVMGTPGAAIHDQVAPRPEEVVVTKRRVGAFGTTDLHTVLRAHDLTTLILLGVATSGVVLSTVRWASDEDYDLVVVEDCCLDTDEEVHRVLTEKVFPRQAQVVSAEAVRAAFETPDDARVASTPGTRRRAKMRA